MSEEEKGEEKIEIVEPSSQHATIVTLGQEKDDISTKEA